MTDAGEKRIYKVTIAAPIDVVWSTLVKTDAVLPFFFGSVCETRDGLKAGAPIRMVTPDRKIAAVVGKVLEFSPPHRYVHTMHFTQFEGEEPATVAYELKEVEGGTEFSLITERAVVGSKTDKSMAQGGPFIVDNLKRLVETGKPAFSGSMVMALNPIMALITPRRCRIENWPLDRAL
jgi:uncharacterized protein YndB with AHSA1/START domain